MRSKTKFLKPILNLKFVAIAVSCIVGVYVSGAVGMSAGYSPKAKTLATTWPLANPWALGNEALQLVNSGNSGSLRIGGNIARSALRQDPTIVPAIVALAILKDLGGDKVSAHRLFEKSLALTRRDLATHLWFIETSSSRQDARSALEHYDAALRTSAAAHEILMPILLKAALDRSLAPPLVDQLLKKPVWAQRCLSQVASTQGDISGVIFMFQLLQQRGYQISPSDRVAVLDQAVDQGMFDQAFQLSGRRRGRMGLINGDFGDEPKYAPFDWKLHSSADFGAEIAKSKDTTGNQSADQLLQLYSNTGSGGEVAKQLVLLEEGDYDLKIKAIVSTPQGHTPYISLSCASDSEPELVRLEMSGEKKAISTSTARFRIQAATSCHAPWLRMFVRPSKTTDAEHTLILSVSIDPVIPARTSFN